MVKLIGEKLRQYDLNRTVELIPKHGMTVETVLFYKNSPEPLVVAHREEDGKIIADIPNIFLKAFGTLAVEVHLIDEDGYRISKQASFYVSKREMPADYVYVETPVLKLGSGGGGVQPDLNQHDPEAPDYVKNRTHWAKEVVETIWYRTSPAFHNGAWALSGNAPKLYDQLKVGHRFIVTLQDVPYECVCFTYEYDGVKWKALGNPAVRTNRYTNSGEPFFLMIKNTGAGTLSVTKKQEDLFETDERISVAKVYEVVQQLDQKFVPNADMNAAEGEPGYIKNRTHGVEPGIKLLPETAADFGDGTSYPLTKWIGLVRGNTYLVNWNGTEYRCVAQALTMDGVYAGIAVGDAGGVSGGESTGEPFVIADFADEYATQIGTAAGIMAMDGSASATVSVESEAGIRKLDSKFLDVEWCAAGGQEQFEGEILPKTAYNLKGNSINSGHDFYSVAPNSDFVKEGDSIEVTFENAIYSLTVRKWAAGANGFTLGFLYAGNAAECLGPYFSGNDFLYSIPSDDVPFCIIFESTNGESVDRGCSVGLANWKESEDKTYTFSIDAVSKFKKMPVKYLPTQTQRKEYVETVAEKTFTVASNMYTEQGLWPLQVGKTYRVMFDGVAYICECKESMFQDMLSLGLGNASLYGGGENTGEPFAIGVITVAGMSGVFTADGEHTIEITEVTQGGMELTLFSPGGKLFKITVDDSGTLTATEVTE